MPLRSLSNPARLATSPSLNLTTFGGAAGLPADLAGTQARDWLTTWSIARLMAADPELMLALAEHGLGVQPLPETSGVSPALMTAAASWPTALDALMMAGDSRAQPVADQLGDALAALVVTLSTAPDEARRARPDWSAPYWDRWRSVRSIVVGGGVVQGRLGVRIVDRAVSRLPLAGVEVALTRAADAAGLGLRGAASLLTGPGVALDCGGTTIKRATVTRATGRRHLLPLPSVPAPGRVGAQEVIDVIADAAVGVLGELPVEIGLAIATYVDESGQPYGDQLGPYAPLGEVDFGDGLAQALRRRSCEPLSVRIIHDGAAALLGARVEHPDADVAIVLGTAIGCSLTPDFA